jgi:hypothetical protein
MVSPVCPEIEFLIKFLPRNSAGSLRWSVAYNEKRWLLAIACLAAMLEWHEKVRASQCERAGLCRQEFYHFQAGIACEAQLAAQSSALTPRRRNVSASPSPSYRAGYWFHEITMPPAPAVSEPAAAEAPPDPTPPPAPAETAKRRFEGMSEAEQYAIIYPDRAALIRAAGGLPPRCEFGPRRRPGQRHQPGPARARRRRPPWCEGVVLRGASGGAHGQPIPSYQATFWSAARPGGDDRVAAFVALVPRVDEDRL